MKAGSAYICAPSATALYIHRNNFLTLSTYTLMIAAIVGGVMQAIEGDHKIILSYHVSTMIEAKATQRQTNLMHPGELVFFLKK